MANNEAGTRKHVRLLSQDHSAGSEREWEVCAMACHVHINRADGLHRSCLLHRFIKNEWRVLTSQTIGVEFASKIIRVGTGNRRKRIKLQVLVSYRLRKYILMVWLLALGHSRNRTLSLRFSIILPRGSWCASSLRPHITFDLQKPPRIPQRRPRTCVPKPHRPPCWQQSRSSQRQWLPN
jgi:hypothetical protein